MFTRESGCFRVEKKHQNKGQRTKALNTPIPLHVRQNYLGVFDKKPVSLQVIIYRWS